MANSSRTFKTERGSVGGSGRAYNLSRQICTVSSSGTFVNNELTSNEHMISLLWLNVLAQSAKLKESLIVRLLTARRRRAVLAGGSVFVWDFPHKVGGSDIFLFISLFIYLSTDRSARHVVSSLGVST